MKVRAAAAGAGSNLNGPICKDARMPGPRTGAPDRVGDSIDGASPPAIIGGAPETRSPEGSGGRRDMVCDSQRVEVVTDADVLDEG